VGFVWPYIFIYFWRKHLGSVIHKYKFEYLHIYIFNINTLQPYLEKKRLEVNISKH
jgi:hypothetical protein